MVNPHVQIFKIMLQQIMTYASMIGMAFAVLLWAQANFVSAGDFQQALKQQNEDKVYTLVIKQEELKKQGRDLESWEKAELERARQRVRELSK